MLQSTDQAMTTPNGWGDAPLPKRTGHKGMLPTTWLNRELIRLEYSSAAAPEVLTISTHTASGPEEEGGWCS